MTEENGTLDVSDEAEQAEYRFLMEIEQAEFDDWPVSDATEREYFPTEVANELIEVAAEEDSSAFDSHVAGLLSDYISANKREMKGEIRRVRNERRDGRLQLHSAEKIVPSSPDDDPVYEITLSIAGTEATARFNHGDILNQQRFRDRVLAATDHPMPNRGSDEWDAFIEEQFRTLDIEVVDQPAVDPADEAAERFLSKLSRWSPVEEKEALADEKVRNAVWHEESEGVLWIPAQKVSEVCDMSYGDPSVFETLSVLESRGYTADQMVRHVSVGGEVRLVGLSVGELIDNEIVHPGYFDPDGDEDGGMA